MIFGDPKEFAIEAALAENPTKHYFAHVCMWADGKRIGLYEGCSPIGVFAHNLELSMRDQSNRRDETISNLSAEQLIDYLNAALFDDAIIELASQSNLRALMNRYALFFLYNLGEAFDGWEIVLIETAESTRLIWRENGWRGDKTLHETKFPIGTYERVASEFVNWASIECRSS